MGSLCSRTPSSKTQQDATMMHPTTMGIHDSLPTTSSSPQQHPQCLQDGGTTRRRKQEDRARRRPLSQGLHKMAAGAPKWRRGPKGGGEKEPAQCQGRRAGHNEWHITAPRRGRCSAWCQLEPPPSALAQAGARRWPPRRRRIKAAVVSPLFLSPSVAENRKHEPI